MQYTIKHTLTERNQTPKETQK